MQLPPPYTILVGSAVLALLGLALGASRASRSAAEYPPSPSSSASTPIIGPPHPRDDRDHRRRALRRQRQPISYADPKSTVQKYIIPVTSARKCDVEINESHFQKIKWQRAQSGEDTKLLGWFNNLCEGTYIEMGALDGVRYSNSYVFSKALNWKGVMIELLEPHFVSLQKNRPSELALVHAGVCGMPQKLHYFQADNYATGGIYEFTAPSFREEWWKDISLDDPRVKEVECDTLDSLLVKYTPEVTYFDFYSLDVEGAEMSVLESINYDRVQFGIILVEADAHNERKNLAMKQMLEMRGYTFLYDYGRSYWFANSNFYEIYKDLIY